MIKAVQIHYRENFDIVLEKAKKAGFNHVSIGFGDVVDALLDENYLTTFEDVKQKLEKHSLICVQTHLPYYSLLLSSDNVDDKMETAIKNCIRLSGMLGAKWVVMHPRSGADFDKKLSFKDNVRDIKNYLPIAREADILLAVENLPVFPGWPTGYHYSSDYKDLCELHDYFEGDPNLCICWDFGHAGLTKGLDHVEALKYVSSRIKCVHIHDNFKSDDDHLVPFLGENKWDELIPTFIKSGYDGAFTLEIKYCDNAGLQGYLNYSYECVTELEKIAKNVTI